MNTLAEQFNLAQQHRIQKFNDAHFEWLIQFESQLTNATTLAATFSHKDCKHYVERNDSHPFFIFLGH